MPIKAKGTLVLETEKDVKENERLDKQHKLNIRVVYEKERFQQIIYFFLDI